MKGLVALLIPIMFCGFSATVAADIYEWTDENGVKHYSNFAPPDQAQVLIKSEELPYTGMSDEELRAAERAEERTAAELEMAERQVEILEKQLAAQRKMQAAEAQAAEMVQEAEALLQKAEEKYRDAYRTRSVYYGYYPLYKRWRHRKKDIVHYKFPYDRRRHAGLKAAPYAGAKRRYGRKAGTGGRSPSRGLKNGVGARHPSPLRSGLLSGGHQMHGGASIYLRFR